MKYFGYAGKILYVDLSKKTIKHVALEDSLIRDFIGGRGFSSKILYDEVDVEADVLAPQNPLIFATGPLSDLAPCSSRLTIAARSPTTGIHGDSNVGGLFALNLKRAGYDVLVIKGRSDKPVYLWINNGNVEIRDASHLWGMSVPDVTLALLKEVGDREASVACIGPAGENQVCSAAVIVDFDRAASKTGMGAVMGNKRVKAVVAKGELETKVYNLKEFKEAFEEAILIYEREPTTKVAREFGSHFLHDTHNTHGALILRNGRLGYLPPEIFKKVCAETINKYNVKSTSGCGYCYLGCTRNFVIDSKKHGRIIITHIDYYGLAPLLYRLDIFDLEEGFYNAKICEELGLDFTVGQLIALMMELYERGIVKREELDDLDLSWGNAEAVQTLLRKIAYREGVGNILADGVLGIIRRYPEASKYALHVKGMDNIPQDARASRTYNFRYAISTRGADHMRVSGLSSLVGTMFPRDLPGAVQGFIAVENFVTMINMLEVCTWAWSAYTSSLEAFKDKERVLVKLYNSVTGANLSIDDLYRAAWRTLLIERAENVRYGLRRKDDTLPERFLKEPLLIEAGRSHPPYTDLDERLDVYYKERGIDIKTGIPKKETLIQLGLGYVAEDLERRGIYKEVYG
ncbi:MAG: aldehyde ferredoxin oxidoreductase family protein [Candidatus Bathyarchaeia archaeon]